MLVHPLLVVLRVEDLVEPGVPLLLVEELNQLGGGDSVCLADRLEHVVDVCSRADGLVDLVEHLISGKSASAPTKLGTMCSNSTSKHRLLERYFVPNSAKQR